MNPFMMLFLFNLDYSLKLNICVKTYVEICKSFLTGKCDFCGI